MSEHTATVVVVGAGIMGASVAYHLAARGCADVLILEQAETEITGSTARAAAGVRHQFSSEVNVRLSLYSIERIKRFAEEIGGHADLKQVGYLLLLDDPADWEQYQQSAAMQRRLGARVELLTPEEAARFIPELRADDLLGATFGPDDGYCDAHGVALGYLTRARQLGARLLRATPAIGIDVAGGRVRGVRTPQGRVSCEVVVNTAGSWAGEVAALAAEYRVEDGRTNPFLHLSMHLTIDEQSSIDQPAGIRAAVQRLAARRGSLHAAHHEVMECLGEMLWNAQRSGLPPDGQAYVEAVRMRAGR